jgi:hypothetical protein
MLIGVALVIVILSIPPEARTAILLKPYAPWTKYLKIGVIAFALIQIFLSLAFYVTSERNDPLVYIVLSSLFVLLLFQASLPSVYTIPLDLRSLIFYLPIGLVGVVFMRRRKRTNDPDQWRYKDKGNDQNEQKVVHMPHFSKRSLTKK